MRTHFSSLVLSVFLFCGLIATNLYSQVNYWQGGSGLWDEQSNWSLGIPTTTHTLIINVVNSTVSIPEGYDAFARGITLSSTCTLTVQGTLKVRNSTSTGIEIESGASLQNDGIGVINISKPTDRGLSNRGSFTNSGSCLIDSCETEGIAILSSGILTNLGNLGISQLDQNEEAIILQTTGTAINEGTINLDTIGYGIILVNASQFTNNGSINIKSVNREAIDVRHSSSFTNNVQVTIENVALTAIENDGTFTNAVTGTIDLNDVAKAGSTYYAIHNDSFSCCTDGLYLGTFYNYGTIEISGCDNIGMLNDNSTTFENSGDISIFGCENEGFLNAARSNFTMGSSSSLSIINTVGNPIIVDKESTFNVIGGAVLDLDIIR